MRNWAWTVIPFVSVFTLGSLIGCIPPPSGDDDDQSPTPVPGTPTPTPEPSPTPAAPLVTLSGTIRAVDAITGEPLTNEQFAQRADVVVVYAVKDPSDLVHILSKATLAAPGHYSMEVPQDSGKVYVIAVADWDFNKVITSVDVSREAVNSPYDVGEEAIDGVDVTLDLYAHGGGGGSDPGSSAFTGTVTYDAKVDTNIAVVAFPGDYAGNVWGKTIRVNSGDFSIGIMRYSSTTALIGYADADGNGVYEPSDPAGLADHNPYPLDGSAISGIQIDIKGIGPAGLPQPIPYVTVSGTVEVDADYAGTPIQLTVANTSGVVYGQATLTGPGNFDIRGPGNVKNVVVTAITDSDGDGVLDVNSDASASSSPFDLGASNVGGITLSLATPPTGISGTVLYSGSVTDADLLDVALFTDPTMAEGPITVLGQDAVFPTSFEFTDVEPGTYYVVVALDVGGDLEVGQPPGPGDLLGGYTLDGSTLAPIVVQNHHMVTNIDVTVGNIAF